MSRQAPNGGSERPRQPGVPTWALVAVVVLALGAAGWLFLRDSGSDPGTGTRTDTTSSDSGTDQDGDVLSLPDPDREEHDDDSDDDPRDGIRLDDPGTRRDEATLRRLRPLRGVRVALAPAASGEAVADQVSVDGRRVACSATADPASVAAEREQLEQVRALLEQAEARVEWIEPTGEGTCVDQRAERLELADLTLVVGIGPENRVVAPAAPEDTRTFAQQLAEALELPEPDRRQAAADRRLLESTGAAFAAPGTVAVLQLRRGSALDEEMVDAVAFAMAQSALG